MDPSHEWVIKFLQELGLDTDKLPIMGMQLTVEVGKLPHLVLKTKVVIDDDIIDDEFKTELRKYKIVEID